MSDAHAPNSPVWRNYNEWLEDEISLCKGGMGNSQLAGVEFAAAPENDIEIQFSRSPAAATAAAELTFERFQFRKHCARLQIAFDQCNRIGKVATGAAACRVKKDGGCIEQAKFGVEPGNGSFNHACRTAVLAMGPIGTDRDSVELRCACH